ncbi:phosphomannomutase/phosphoglucomutase [Luteococcus peritonei]
MAPLLVLGGLRGRTTGAEPELDADLARLAGAAYADVARLAGQSLVLAHDTRAGGQELSRAVADGARSRGAHVVDMGLASLDHLAFDAGLLEVHGVHVGAPGGDEQSNGLTFLLPDATPADPATTAVVVERIEQFLADGLVELEPRGSLGADDTLADYARQLRDLAPVAAEGLLVVVGAAGPLSPALVEAVLVTVGVALVRTDGPGVDQVRGAVLQHGARAGLVLDDDASRCTVLDEHGRVVEATTVATLLERHLPEGQAPQLGEDGLARFADHYLAPSGLLLARRVLALLAGQTQPLSVLVAEARGLQCQVLDLAVSDPQAAIGAVRQGFQHHHVTSSTGDELLLSGQAGRRGDYRIGLRAHEAAVQVLVEASDTEVMAALREDLREIVARVA